MSLILAINPGNGHSPTLSRLARELPGCELIGADSCVVAIGAVKERVPNLVLLPAKTAQGQADLMAHLRTIPGGVPTLTLPPVEKADPVELARLIRDVLTDVRVTHDPGPAGVGEARVPDEPTVAASPHLIAAANAAIEWIRTRRAVWDDERWAAASAQALDRSSAAPSQPEDIRAPLEQNEGTERDHPLEAFSSDGPHATAEPQVFGAMEIKTWLPRAALLTAIIGFGGALVSCWPEMRAWFSGPAVQLDSARGTDRPTAVTRPAPATAPGAGSTPQPDAFANLSGWVAVFSPFDVQITGGGREVRVDDRGRALLSPGRHRLRFQNLQLGYDETRTVDVRPTETTTINLTPQTSIRILSSEPAEVWIDGSRVGDTPFDGSVGLGTRAVTLRTARAERQLTIEVTVRPVQLEVDFSKP